jgi:hypothetical protein
MVYKKFQNLIDTLDFVKLRSISKINFEIIDDQGGEIFSVGPTATAEFKYIFDHSELLFSFVCNISVVLKELICEVCGRVLTTPQKLRRHNCISSLQDGSHILSDKYQTYRAGRNTNNSYDSSSRYVGACSLDIECGFSSCDYKTNCNSFVNNHEIYLIVLCNDFSVVAPRVAVFLRKSRDDSSYIADFFQHLTVLQVEFEVLAREQWVEELNTLHLRIAIAQHGNNTYWANRYIKMKNRLEANLIRMPIFTWFGSGYDYFILINSCGLIGFLYSEDRPVTTCKKQGCYMSIQSRRFLFKDCCSFTGVKVSLRHYLRSMFPHLAMGKSYFPHSLMEDDWELALGQSMPPEYDAFVNRITNQNDLQTDYDDYLELKNHGVSDSKMKEMLGVERIPPPTGRERYEHLCSIEWKGLNTIAALAIYYCILDTYPLLAVARGLKGQFAEYGLDICEYQSLSSMSIHVAFSFVANKVRDFVLVFTEGSFARDLRQNLFGGYSSPMERRYGEVGVTHIRHHAVNPRLVSKILNYDQNSCYSYAQQFRLPVSVMVYRNHESGYYPQLMGKPHHYDSIANVLYIAAKLGYDPDCIQHMATSGGEAKLYCPNYSQGLIYADGYHVESRTVIESLECGWGHGHCPHHQQTKAPYLYSDGRTGEQMYLQTIERLDAIVASGYNLHVGWLCEFMDLLKSDPLARRIRADFKFGPSVRFETMTHPEMIDAILDQEIEGYVKCDMRLNGEARKYFKQHYPIFKRATITRESLSEPIKGYCARHNLFKTPTTQLVTSTHAEQVLYHTHFLKWLLEHDVTVTNITEVYQFEHRHLFTGFIDHCAGRRAEAILNGQKLTSQTLKLLLNSNYGKLCQNPAKFRDVEYVDMKSPRFLHLINSELLTEIVDCEDDIFEISSKRNVVKESTPVHLALAILNISKMTMLRFLYDFVDVHIDRDLYCLSLTDTDSYFFFISGGDSFRAIAKDQRLYDEAAKEYMVDESTDETTRKTIKKPGLFSLEADSAWVTVSLVPKQYIQCFPDNVDNIKSKGVNKRRNRDLLRLENFREALFERAAPRKATNYGFIRKEGVMYSVLSEKSCLHSGLVKRRVLPCMCCTAAFED